MRCLVCLAVIGVVFAQTETFDVASIKAFHDDGERPRNARSYSPEGINFGGCSLGFIISEAYNFPPGRIVGPESLTKESLWGALSQGYDLIAKTDHPVPKGQIRVMLQALLAERFHLALHRESKPGRVYRLVVAPAGPKLTDSPDANGSFSVTGGPDGYVFRNTDMMRLSGALSGRVGRAVVDETGLEGSYDFTLRMPPGWQTDQPAKSEAQSPDSPSFGTFSDALKHLGLQLITGTAAVEYLVVDRVERPTEN